MHLHFKARLVADGTNEFPSLPARLVPPHAAPDRSSIQAHKDSRLFQVSFPISVDQRLGDSDSGNGSATVAWIVRLLRLVAPPLPVTVSVTV